MKRTAVAVGVVVGLGLGVPPLAAQDAGEGGIDWLTANVAVTSDYTFRGISQTLEEAAIQGGMDLAHPLGLYLGVWGSNVNFGEDLAAGARAQVEFDVYGGFGTRLRTLADLDLGFVYYAYPGAGSGRQYDFLELGAGVSRSAGPLSTEASVRYSPDFFAGSGTGLYYGGDLGVALSVVTLRGSVGRQSIEENSAFGTPDYLDWSLGAGVAWQGFEFSGAYRSTDLSQEECFGGSDLCRSRAVFSIGRAL